MAKRFVVESPDQLRELEIRSLLKEGSVLSTARVWQVARRQGKTTWDGKIVITFLSKDSGRVAMVCRQKANGDGATLAVLKYNPALAWCRENLKEA